MVVGFKKLPMTRRGRHYPFASSSCRVWGLECVSLQFPEFGLLVFFPKFRLGEEL